MNNDVSATSLRDRIAEYTTAMANAAPPEDIATLSAELRKLAESGIAKDALQIGGKAPDFTLPSTQGKPVTLSEYKGKKNVVLAFFPAAFTGG